MGDTTTRTRLFFAEIQNATEDEMESFWERFDAKYRRRLIGVCRKIDPQGTHEDIVQLVFLRIYESMKSGTSWDPYRGTSLFNWLYLIVYRTLITEIKKNKTWPLQFAESETELQAVTKDVATAESIELAWIELKTRLDRIRYECYRLSYEGWKPREIAEHFMANEQSEISSVVISRKIYEASKIMREIFIDFGHEELLEKLRPQSDTENPESKI